jgi:glycosyltransferase involved in cell wall biosynthesis
MNFVRFFRRYGDVDLLYFYNESEDAGEEGVFAKEHYIRHPSCAGPSERGAARSLAGRLDRVLRRRPWMVTEWPPEAKREYLSIVNGGRYDIIFCRYILETEPLFLLGKDARRRVVLDYDDVFSDSLFGMHSKADAGLLSVLKSRVQKNFLLNYEKKCLEFGTVLFTNARDRSRIAGEGRSNAHIVPNVVPWKAGLDGIGSGYPNRNTFLFVGALNYGPNIEGLKWFVEEVYLPARKELEAARLLVVGRQPAAEVRALCDPEAGIELHPDVPDVAPFYARSGALVVPILTAGGTRIKILEAGYYGRPVLSTPMGAYGIDAEDGRELFLFEDRESFLRGCRRLGEAGAYESMAERMRSMVKDRFSPESFHRRMEGAVRHLISPDPA